MVLKEVGEFEVEEKASGEEKRMLSAFETKGENWLYEVEAQWRIERRETKEILSDELDLVK